MCNALYPCSIVNALKKKKKMALPELGDCPHEQSSYFWCGKGIQQWLFAICLLLYKLLGTVLST